MSIATPATDTGTRYVLYSLDRQYRIYTLRHGTPVECHETKIRETCEAAMVGMAWRRLLVQGIEPAAPAFPDRIVQSDARDRYAVDCAQGTLVADSGRLDALPLGVDLGVLPHEDPEGFDSFAAAALVCGAGVVYDCPECHRTLPEPAHGRATGCAICGAGLYPGLPSGRSIEAYFYGAGISIYMLDQGRPVRMFDFPRAGEGYQWLVAAGMVWRRLMQGHDPRTGSWVGSFSAISDEIQGSYDHDSMDYPRPFAASTDMGRFPFGVDPCIIRDLGQSEGEAFLLASSAAYECPSCGWISPHPALGRTARCAICGAELRQGIAAR